MASNHQPVTSSGYVTSSKSVVDGSGAAGASKGPGGYLHSVQLLSNATDACSVVIYNSSTSTSGQEVATLSIPASTTAPQTITFNNPVSCPKGIYAALGGSNGKVIVGYSVGN